MAKRTGAERARCRGRLWFWEREEGGERLKQQQQDHEINGLPLDCGGLF